MAKITAPLEIEAIGEVIVVTFRDRILLDRNEIELIYSQLCERIGKQPGIRLLIDFSAVQALSSEILGVLVNIGAKVKDAQGHLVLCNLHRTLEEIFEVTQLKNLLDVHPDRAVALEVLGSR